MIVTDEKTLDLFRDVKRCQWCHRPIQGRAQPHHWRHRGMGGGSRLDIPINLIAVDAECHTYMEAKAIPPEAVLLVIALREKRSPESIVDEINLILRTPKGTNGNRPT